MAITIRPKVVYITGDVTDEESRRIITEAEDALRHRGFCVLNAARMPAGLPAAKRFLLGKACIEAADAVLFTATDFDSEMVKAEDIHSYQIFATAIHLSSKVSLETAVKWIEEVTR